MRFLSVCSGIEAASVAWGPIGWTPYVLSEIEAFPREVLRQRHQAHDARRYVPDWAPLLWGDFRSIKERFLRRFGRSLADVDVLAGGTPCQAFSVAGLRRSMDDDRGNLSLAFVRLANAIDNVRLRAGKPPVWIVWENVPGVLSTRDNAFGSIMAGMVGSDAAVDPGRKGWTHAGVAAGPARCAAWRILDAQHFGLAQRRRRVIVVARGYFGGAGEWDGPDALLPVVAGGDWDSAPRREAGQRPAGTISARTECGGGLGTDFDLDGGLLAHSITTRAGNASRNVGSNGNIVSHTLNAKGGGGRIDAESETFVVAHTLKASGFDASEDGTGRGVPLVPMTTGTLSASGRAAGSATGQDAASGLLVPMGIAMRGRDGGATAEITGDIAGALRTGGGGGDKPHVLSYRTTGNDGVYATGGVAPCLNTATDPNQTILLRGGDVDDAAMAVRRLTPRECERLQGFPDDYTAIPVKGKPAADGPRYKALGNSWAVPKMHYVGERIAVIDRARKGELKC